MRTLLVGYDLNKPEQNYAGLIAQLKSYGAWWHCLDSTWLIKTTMTATALRDALKPLIDSGDELLVLDVSQANWAWAGFTGDCGTWIRNHL